MDVKYANGHGEAFFPSSAQSMNAKVRTEGRSEKVNMHDRRRTIRLFIE
jgi:hypothetical protein